MKTRQEFFAHYLRHCTVAHALWRSYECERFAQERFQGPILDLGCGDGFFASAVFGHLDAGIDLDGTEIERAEKKGIYDVVICASATRMPFKSGAFRTVVSNCVLEHIPDIDAVLKECFRVLKPGGIVVTTVPSEIWDSGSYYLKFFRWFGFNEAGQWYNRKLNQVFRHYHVDEKKVWATRFRKAGFKLVKAEYLIPEQVHHTFERWFIPAIPAKIWKSLFKRWILIPASRFWAPGFFNWWFRDMLKLEGEKGVCYYLVARKQRAR